MKKLISVLIFINMFGISYSLENNSNIKYKSIILTNEVNSIDKMRLKYKEFLIGYPLGIEVKNKNLFNQQNVDKIDSDIESFLSKINKDNDKYVFDDFKDMTNGGQVRTSLLRLETLAKGYEIESSKFYNSKEIKEILERGLNIIVDRGYNSNVIEKGNWWFYEIGIPKTINEILIILGDDLNKNIKNKLVESSRYFQPDPYYSGMSPAAKFSSSPNKRLSTGGNRADTALISFARGIVSKNKEEIKKSLEALPEVLDYVEVKDGFYKDGSFIQHDNVAYNGTYGSVLLNGIAIIMYITGNTEYQFSKENMNNLYDILEKGYIYLLVNGGINDSVNGRAISRDNSSDLDRAKPILAAISLISEGSDKENKIKLQEIVKRSILDNNKENIIDSTKNLVIKSLYDKILNTNIVPRKVNGVKIFNNMDRVSFFNTKGGKFVLSMYSNRIANFETMNKENLKGWYTGDGMTYIYTNDSNSFVNYWPTVDLLKLPGTTEINEPREKGTGERRLKDKLAKTTFVGGATDSKKAIIAMDFTSYNDTLTAKKSWVIDNDEIIAIASNIKGTGQIITTVDNRKIDDNTKVYLNNKLITKNTKLTGRNNIINIYNEKRNENIGYIIPNEVNGNIIIENNEGSFKEIGGKSSEIIKEKYCKIEIDNTNNNSYYYIILPMIDKNDVSKYNYKNIKILRLDDKIHAIKIENKEYINFFEKGKINGVEVNNPVSLILEKNNKNLNLILSNPSHFKDYKVEIKINGKKLEVQLPEDGSSIEVKLNR